MPKKSTVKEIQAVINKHGGSRNAGRKFADKHIANESSNVEAAGDWIPNGKCEIEIPESPSFFYISEMLDDGYLPEEILALEDMYPTMYNRVK